jgi:hypothetical protein
MMTANIQAEALARLSRQSPQAPGFAPLFFSRRHKSTEEDKGIPCRANFFIFRITATLGQGLLAMSRKIPQSMS